MTPPPSSITPDVDPVAGWAGIGQYLQRDSAQLITPERRATLQESWQDITQQEENLDDAILIGLVGGTGVGKSTFINALAAESVSRSSDRRPTTDRVVVYRHVQSELPDDVPADDLCQPQVMHDNDAIEKVILFDFPDFDSAETSHTHIIRRYLPYLDVLLVVVDDVKYADRRLYELLRTLDHDPNNIFVLFNKVDRLQDRYGQQTSQVVEELLADLSLKLRENGQLKLGSEQLFPIAALSEFTVRTSGANAVAPGREPSGMTAPDETNSGDASEDASPKALAIASQCRFDAVQSLLESYQAAKHRRAAKERNIDARKREVVEALRHDALGKENEATLAEAKRMVESWRNEMDKALHGVPLPVLSDAERRGAQRAHLRLAGPEWGLPFSLFFTLIGELKRRGTQVVEPTDLGQRVMHHYRGFFESLKNLRSRFASEFSGSQIHLGSLQQSAPREMITASPTELARDLQTAVQQTPASVPLSRRGIAHLPGLGTLALAIWGQLHPILESAVGEGESGVIWASLMALIGTLSPTFIVATIVGVLFVYLLTSLVIWLREVQRLDHAITKSEQATREVMREQGRAAVDSLDQDVRGLYEEFEELDGLLA